MSPARYSSGQPYLRWRQRHYFTISAALFAVFLAAIMIFASPAARADSYPATQNLELGGINLGEYCQTNYDVNEPWWIQILSSAQVDTFPYINAGSGLAAAYNWRCLVVTTANGLSDEGMQSYESAMAAWNPAAGPAPNLADFAGMSIDSQGSFAINMHQACQQQYGEGAFAILSNPNDIASWKCYVQILTDYGYMG
jgi:hypothetical protein